MGDLLYDPVFNHLKGEMEDTAKSHRGDQPGDQQPAAGERGEAGSGSSAPERPQQAGPTDDVDGAESEVEVDGKRKADGKKGGASKGVEGGSEKKAANAEAEAEVDRQRPGWFESAQSMSAPWYPYT
ncbi:hypothetical protein B0A55_07715 [Friedmanniomyces simplex]|uniref:Uncharacterized protein n=1 Tax=Friedmanniomyces simplex TaxID=329884 RepID=A0A4U0X7Z6_9PEZI|nr:hypothetical protein B0A55_07715 [Friedmanniomyces simplex]